jgi:predicted DNA binding CopG/RHH family protein
MSKIRLSKDEKELLDSVESGDFVSTLTTARKEELEAVATNNFKTDKRINIRISNRDLIAVQSRESEEGFPYQTLVSSIIHKYVSDSLRDIAANKKRQGDAYTRACF